jgi:nicotinate-nucleotide adenylyltransferase
MQFFRRATEKPARLGILSGTFHPPTRAHLALARAGLAVTDEVLFVLPRVFPHKTYEAVGFTERLRMLEAALAGEPRFSIATTEGGLFVEIARECRTAYGVKTQLKFLCGRDAAQRIVNWDYGKPGTFKRMLREFELLVADRKGTYEPPPDMQDRVHRLPIACDYDDISASDVRGRIARGEAWEHLHPEAIVPLVRELYED